MRSKLVVRSYTYPCTRIVPHRQSRDVKKTVDVLAQENHARKSKVKVLASYIAPPEHTLYFILEADSYEAITEFLSRS